LIDLFCGQIFPSSKQQLLRHIRHNLDAYQESRGCSLMASGHFSLAQGTQQQRENGQNNTR
jgi:hypothetical protein